jgi:hypothetical protein
MASENQGIPKENFAYVPAAHRDADTQRTNNIKNGKGKMSAEDEEEEGDDSQSNGEPIARWRR